MLKRVVYFLWLIWMLIPMAVTAQLTDSVKVPDSTAQKVVLQQRKNYPPDTILKGNFLLNSQAKPVFSEEQVRKPVLKDPVFYFIAALLLFLGILRASFDRYFTNLLRVFFNTSLRQSQLTDQLLQAKLPSLFFNIFFVIIAGLYLYLLLIYFGKAGYADWLVLLFCIGAVLAVYIVKFIVLKFSGWLTSYGQEAETYVFVVFLINKMIAIILAPLVVIIAFSGGKVATVAVIVSFILIGLMLILRFFRSYGLLQHRLRVSRLHFFLYIIGIELLPILLIYKAALLIMSKNL